MAEYNDTTPPRLPLPMLSLPFPLALSLTLKLFALLSAFCVSTSTTLTQPDSRAS
jgi:hypothetical protein